MTVRVQVRNGALVRVAEAEEFYSLDLRLRFCATSTWELQLPADSPAALALTFSGGIVVSRDGATVLSGPVKQLSLTYANGKTVLVARGVDDTGLLERRLALPVPSGPPYTAAETDNINGPAETVLRYYVGRNLGPSATTARKIADLQLETDLARGLTVRGQARYVNLLELLQGLATVGAVGFRIVQVGTARHFAVYEPADKTAEAKFSPELGNLAGYDYSTTAPTGNHVYVGGQGEGTARTIVERSDSGSITAFGRYETFRDRRDSPDTVVLEQSGDEELASRGATSSLKLSPIDTPEVQYGTTYGLGDRITVVVDGAVLTDVVREVRLTYGDNGEQVTPVVGSDGASLLPGQSLFDAIRRLGRRLNALERV